MSGRSRVRRVRVSPVSRPKPELIRLANVLAVVALETERSEVVQPPVEDESSPDGLRRPGGRAA